MELQTSEKKGFLFLTKCLEIPEKFMILPEFEILLLQKEDHNAFYTSKVSKD